MDRLKLFFLNIILLAGVIGTLLFTAPGLAAEPIGYAAIYIPMIGACLVLSRWIGRTVSAIVAAFWLFIIFGFMGAPGSVIFAIIMTAVTFTLVRRKSIHVGETPTKSAELMAIDHAARLGS